jgi:tetratricopeptide (TPR) repeat protein
MSYIGNPGLPEEMQERILNVFQQALDLAEAGSHEEAILGCDFVLQMDPLFTPAQSLMERVKAGEGPVEVDDLRSRLSGEAPTQPAGKAVVEEAETQASEGNRAVAAELEGVMREALNERDFRRALEVASGSPDIVAANPELAELAEAAQARHEAAPYMEKFLDSARGSLEAGDFEQAEIYLKKAEMLDSTHPGIVAVRELEAHYQQAAGVPAEAPAPAAEGEEAGDEVVGPAFDVVDEGESELELGGDVSQELGGDVSQELGGDAISFDDVSDLDVDGGDDEILDLDLDDDQDGDDLEEAEPAAEPETDEEPAAELDSREEQEAESVSEEADDATQAFQGEESDQRIVELLSDGQERYDDGDYQGAIDAWSRIFLIDIDHPEASRRIEEARKHKEEGEREIEEIFQVGLEQLQADEVDEAKATFESVLERQPGHLGAQEYLEKLEAGETPSVATVEPPQDDAYPDPAGGIADFESDFGVEDTEPEEDLEPVPAGRSKKSFIYVGGAVLALVLVGGWFLFSGWDRFFPNADDAVQTLPEPSPIERAAKLHEDGKTAIAISQLKRIPPTHADYDQAQALIQEWESPEDEDQGPDPAMVARREELIRRARAAFSSRQYLKSVPLLEKANEMATLETAEGELLREARIQVEPLMPLIARLRESEYEDVLPKLWLLWDQDRENRDVAHLLTTSYYNLGVRHLQRGNPALAHEMFGEALGIEQDDEDLQRLYLFAQTFKTRSHGRDLVYRIFVKYLPFRSL